MNYGPLIFLAAFFALSASWFGLVLKPQVQIGRELPGTNMVNKAEMYPQGRPGLARQGLDVYRANGCAYCHSQQVGQTGIEINVVLSKAGTNPVAVAEALLKANVGVSNLNGAGISAGLPKTILRHSTMDAAKAASQAVQKAGGEARIDIVPVGPDISRGWGPRRTVAQDFLYDDPVMLGSLRVGPDLANVGVRWPDANWHLRHLYAPKSEVKDSPMPSYQFLFEKRKLRPGQQPSPDAIPFTLDADKKGEPADYEIVPKPEARALAAYLLSLRAITPLFETPMTVPAAPTSAAATNAPPEMSPDVTKSVPNGDAESQSRGPTVPIWLIVLTGLLLYGGAVYFDLKGGWFSPKVYGPYRNVAEVESLHVTGPADPSAIGQVVYGKTCVVCHMATGLGAPGQFPPLVASEWVNEKEPGRIIRAVLNGLQGPITVDGKAFNGSMTPWGADPPAGLSDEDIAAVLTYIRQNKEWKNDAPPVTPERVKAVRETLKAQGKKNAFTADELLKIPPGE